MMWVLLLRQMIIQRPKRLLLRQILLVHKFPKLGRVRVHHIHRSIVYALIHHVLAAKGGRSNVVRHEALLHR